MRKRKVPSVKMIRFTLFLNGFLSFAGAISITALIFSFIMSKIDVPDTVISVMSGISLCAGGLAAGYSVSKRRRRNGLLTGIFCGIIIFFFVLFIGLIFVHIFTAVGVITKFIIITVCSAIGGVIGVNSPLRIR